MPSGKTEGVLLVRVQLPDRPGSLGQVATALGALGADIEAIEIVERGPGYAINHFMVELPTAVMPDALVSACTEIDDVRVMWVSRYPDHWGIESDMATLNRMADNPALAATILTEAAPVVFHCQWAVLASDGQVLAASELAPELDGTLLDELSGDPQPARHHRPMGWLPDWGEQEVATARLHNGSVIIVGRTGGPPFLHSELMRLRHLAGLALDG